MKDYTDMVTKMAMFYEEILMCSTYLEQVVKLGISWFSNSTS